jgi:hypothetical protein
MQLDRCGSRRSGSAMTHDSCALKRRLSVAPGMNVGSRLPTLAAQIEDTTAWTAGGCRPHCISCFNRGLQPASDIHEIKKVEKLCVVIKRRWTAKREELQTFILCDSATQPAVRYL